jgi:hypothetical protein
MANGFPHSATDPQLKQQITAHLQPGESILWLGKPSAWSTVSPLQAGLAWFLAIAGASLYLGLWAHLPFALLEQFPTLIALANRPQMPTVILLGGGLLLGAIAWHRRSSTWAYAVTDKRLLVVFGNKILREKNPRQLKYVRVNERSGDKGDVYWEKRSKRESRAYDDDGNSVSQGPDGRYVGFKGQTNARQLCAQILAWQERSLEAELDVSVSSAREYLASVEGAKAGQPTSFAAAGSQSIRNVEYGFAVDVPAGWNTRVSQRKYGVIPFVKSSYRDGPFAPYADNLGWNLLITEGTGESWLEIACTAGALTTDWDSASSNTLGEFFGQEVVAQNPDLTVGTFTGFSIARLTPPEVKIPNYGITKTPTHLQMCWLSDGELSLQIRSIVPADSPTLQQVVAAIILSLRAL